MYADLLEDGLSDDEDSALGGYAGVISQESLRLSRMISNVLNFARHERGSLTLNRGEWSVDEIVGEVVEQFKEALCEKRISVKVNAAQSQMVEVDRDVLLQILYNLLSNAEKYLPAGSSIFIEHAQILSDTVVKVIDDGPGIPEELRDAVFEPFYRVSDSMNEGVSGTGLGLAISRELARLHGGDLTLEDSKKGAIFFLTINAPLVHDEQDGEIVE
jgi:signal transduction histidine kinase